MIPEALDYPDLTVAVSGRRGPGINAHPSDGRSRRRSDRPVGLPAAGERRRATAAGRDGTVTTDD